MTAVLTGTPSTAHGGIYNFSITATNSGNFTVTNDYTLIVQAPTAAGVTVSGRVTDAGGRGVYGARLLMFDPHGERRYARTNPFGFYHFTETAAGAVYTISVAHKKHRFAPRVFSATDNTNDFNFTAEPR